MPSRAFCHLTTRSSSNDDAVACLSYLGRWSAEIHCPGRCWKTFSSPPSAVTVHGEGPPGSPDAGTGASRPLSAKRSVRARKNECCHLLPWSLLDVGVGFGMLCSCGSESRNHSLTLKPSQPVGKDLSSNGAQKYDCALKEEGGAGHACTLHWLEHASRVASMIRLSRLASRM